MYGCRCWLPWLPLCAARCLAGPELTGRFSLTLGGSDWQPAMLDPPNHLINSPPDGDDGDEGGGGERKNVDVHIRGVMDHLPPPAPLHTAPLSQSVGSHSLTPTERSLTLDS